MIELLRYIKSYIIWIIVIILFKLPINAQDSLLYEINVEKSLLGTVVSAKVISDDIQNSKRALYYAFKEIERIDSLYDYSNPNSIIYIINQNAYTQSIKLDSETFCLLKRAMNYSIAYEGQFDVSLGALTDLWGFSKEAEIILPSKYQIDRLLKSVGSKNIILDSLNLTCHFTKPDLKIDLGGIAKGYAVDQAAKILDSYKIDNYIVNTGGDLTAKGKNKMGENWVVGIKHPRENDTSIAVFSASSSKTCVASSGDYERYKIIDGVRYHHILNPFTGYCENKSQSVTVIADNTESATALAKYIFLIGADKFLTLQLSKEVKYHIVNSEGVVFTNLSK